ncbi:hypothetical protein [Patulibacter minatonensis]|uniref:hypothetical protein n=1 Tax=Patulibacter minatonensis TaxID=298163 RepID=UPI00047A405A|nr:hypothetical protein [Patulibacter minatonensis]
MLHPTDPLLTRLRAADPAATTTPAADRPAVRRALAHRSRAATRRRWAMAPAPVLGAVLAGALVLVPSGTPALAQIVDRAAAASAPSPGTIVMVRSSVESRSTTAGRDDAPFALEERGWVRFARDGRPLDVRSVRLRSSDQDDGGAAPGFEETTTYPRSADGTPTSQAYDPRTGRTTTQDGTAAVPRLVFRAHELLERARRGTAGVRLDGERTVDGRRVFRLVIEDRGDGGPVPGIAGRTELDVDASTYAPVAYRDVTEGRTQPGDVPFRTEVTQRVIEHDELPDTPATRRLLELRGPREP